MTTFATTAFAIALPPLAFIAAKAIRPTLKPPRYRPFLFVIGGLFFELLALMTGWSLHLVLDRGVVQFRSRLLGAFYADSSQPAEYWLLVSLIYGMCILFAGLGLAGFSLCFRRSTGP